ncbi:glycosyltransferase family 2 protein [Mongoliitalea daihaiensis]|uniref:glycosyltransferase family 2 protein n=1 Tax=Mongoliitalea daihaiensis TaxID=2782006 RepID=UPI001F280CD1|nr:glycosyltransferase family 2 protein [Mongoliitalea daihaiensis]UJP64518.1 glycosyltransferase family 2 protein [Mongoliitalea daihaiensis]
METIFIISLSIIFYTYLGYALIIYLLVKFKTDKEAPTLNTSGLPFVSVIVPCFNEGEQLRDKIQNTLDLIYPQELIEYIFICDGSSDGSEQIPASFSEVKTMFSPERKGKLAAMKRAVKETRGEILVFCDGNTVLNPEAVLEMVKFYQDPLVGAVTGEKYILVKEEDAASSQGEGFYWKYESFLKKMDANWNTLVGGAGELMSYRKELFEFLPDDTILDDFMLTMKIAEKGYKVKYAPEARASEFASANVEEELKRKIRIAAGGWQSIARLPKAANPFHDFALFFQYISHRVLRWTVTPFLLVVVFVLNHLLAFQEGKEFYTNLLFAQYAFYGLALLGYIFRNQAVSIKGFHVPYYFYVMNYAAIRGFLRWMQKKQPATWERAKRAG